MADDKLKQELLYMASLASKYDFSKMEVVEGILRLENERKILDSVFGRRFKSRIFDIAAGVSVDDACVMCGQPAENHVICKHCMSTVLDSDYAKNKIKTKQRRFKLPSVNIQPVVERIKGLISKIHLPKIEFSAREKNTEEIKENVSGFSFIKIFKYIALVCLTLILFVQIWLLYLWSSIPTYNPVVEAVVSAKEATPVTSAEEAMAQLAIDFPEEKGYTITYSREDSDYVGRFLLEKGDCCQEIEEQLTDEERYDYFFTEPVYIFYISNVDELSARIGMAEVNQAGAILVMGSFNDGRRTDCYYKYR
ncbi:MAG: hypothetical protein IKW81_06490 [Pseudobutyrivibrio sp.]|nr:hypothetical protein [Pseudobutyrivibrio sp.]